MEKRVGVGLKFRHLHPGLGLGGGVNALLTISLLASLLLNLFSGPSSSSRRRRSDLQPGCIVEAPRRRRVLSAAETGGFATGGSLLSISFDGEEMRLLGCADFMGTKWQKCVEQIYLCKNSNI